MTCPLLSFRYGKIVSTKAILDKTTNKCKGEVADGPRLAGSVCFLLMVKFVAAIVAIIRQVTALWTLTVPARRRRR